MRSEALQKLRGFITWVAAWNTAVAECLKSTSRINNTIPLHSVRLVEAPQGVEISVTGYRASLDPS